MTKAEILKSLAPFPDEIDVSVTDGEEMQIRIKHLDFHWDKGIGEITIVPMGSHLSENEDWARL